MEYSSDEIEKRRLSSKKEVFFPLVSDNGWYSALPVEFGLKKYALINVSLVQRQCSSNIIEIK